MDECRLVRVGPSLLISNRTSINGVFRHNPKTMKTINKILLILTSTVLALTARADNPVPTQHNEATIAELQAEMASGKLTSRQLTQEYIARIIALDQNGPGVNSIIELNPDAL